MGANKTEEEHKVKDRLERRRQRLNQGLSESECDILEQEDIQAEKEEERKRRNILLDLKNEYDKVHYCVGKIFMHHLSCDSYVSDLLA